MHVLLEIMKHWIIGRRQGRRPRDVGVLGSPMADLAEAQEGRSLVAPIGSRKGMEAYAG